MRNLKVLGLALVAVLALSAMAATSAFANYNSEAETTTLTGVQETANVFTTNKGTVKCTTANFSGTQTGSLKEAGVFTAKTVEVHPSYSGCKAFGLAAEVNTTGCNYLFNEATTSASPTATVNIKCSAGSSIVVTAGGGSCVIKVGEQSNLSNVGFTNSGSGASRSILVTANVGGIAYAASGECGAETASNGTYTGSVKVTGNHGIWVS